MAYNKVTPQIIEELSRIVGQSHVVTSVEERKNYAHDETPQIESLPEVVVKPITSQEISEILLLANKHNIPVTPRGGGTGLSGGSVPIYGGIVVSLERMNKILEIDKDNLMLTVEPGVIDAEINKQLEKYHLFYPVDPASLDSCFIGGNIAECAGGASAVKYGVTKNYVCGLEVVLPTGEILSLGGKLVKNVTGYDLISLIVGSEGTLAIVTKIILKLLPLAKVRIDLLVPFEDLKLASQSVSDIIASQIIPTTIEFMDQKIIKICEKYLKRSIPFDTASAHLLIALEGASIEEVMKQSEQVGEICLKNNALEILIAKNKTEQDNLWQARRSIRDAIKETSLTIDEDIVVPRSLIPEFMEKANQICHHYKIESVTCGHAGDGNIHINLLKKDLSDQQWQEITPQVVKELFQTGVKLGGMISGEHGIGLAKKKYLSLSISQEQIELMKRIKYAFDPNNILNPGKIF